MKKVLVGIVAFSVTLVVFLVAAFEAHVINVTASIDSTLSVPLNQLISAGVPSNLPRNLM